MNRLQGMELFVEVARTLSFGRAAENLAIPKSTLSRQVAELERSVGLRLLSRTTRRVELTEAGQLYFERCQRIVAEARIAHEELQNLVETPSGPLRVNMPADFGTDFLSEAFTEFSRRYPEVTFYLDLASPEHAERVFQTCDVSIEIGDLPDSTHIARLLGVLPAHLYASPDYLARHGEPQHPDDLPRHECIQFRAGTGRVTRWPLNSGERHVEITPGNRFSVNSVSMGAQPGHAGRRHRDPGAHGQRARRHRIGPSQAHLARLAGRAVPGLRGHGHPHAAGQDPHLRGIPDGASEQQDTGRPE